MRRKGFSLFEILVSLIVLSIAITGMIVLFTSSKQFVLHSRSTFSGAELGKGFLDPLQQYVRQDQWGNNCLSTDPPADCPGPQTDISTNIVYTPTYNIWTVAGANTLRGVKTTIQWTEPSP